MEAEQRVKSLNMYDVLEDDSTAGIPVVPEKPVPVRTEHRANAHTRGAHPQGFHGKGHRAPKREFERHSAPGHERTTHKGGAGRHNWGSEQDDINQVNKAIAEVGLDAVAAGAVPIHDAEQPSATEQPSQQQQQQVAQEEPDNTKTFEQFQAELKRALVADEAKERGVNVDDKAFKKSEPLSRRDEDVAFADQIKVKSQKKKEKNTKRSVHLDEFRATLPASADNEDEFRRDGERGGRGRGRGGRGRGGRGRGGRGGRGGFGGQYFEHAEAAPAIDAFASASAPAFDGAVAQDPAAPQDPTAAAAPADAQGFRGGRGRGGRGRGRGGRGRGGPRGGSRGGPRGGYRGGRGRGGRGGYSRDHGDAGLNISDESAFPSLSK